MILTTRSVRPANHASPAKMGIGAPGRRTSRRPTAESDHLHGASLGSLLSLDDLELDLHAVLQDGAPRVVGVNKHVLPATIRRDETETLTRVEELDRTSLHLRVPVSFPASLKWEAWLLHHSGAGARAGRTLTPVAIGGRDRVLRQENDAKAQPETGSVSRHDAEPGSVTPPHGPCYRPFRAASPRASPGVAGAGGAIPGGPKTEKHDTGDKPILPPSPCAFAGPGVVRGDSADGLTSMPASSR